jgi:ribosome biogenesis protein Nip4
MKSQKAGLLTSPIFEKPSQTPWRSVAKIFQKHYASICIGVTAAGTVQDLHLIPF